MFGRSEACWNAASTTCRIVWIRLGSSSGTRSISARPTSPSPGGAPPVTEPDGDTVRVLLQGLGGGAEAHGGAGGTDGVAEDPLKSWTLHADGGGQIRAAGPDADCGGTNLAPHPVIWEIDSLDDSHPGRLCRRGKRRPWPPAGSAP